MSVGRSAADRDEKGKRDGARSARRAAKGGELLLRRWGEKKTKW